MQATLDTPIIWEWFLEAFQAQYFPEHIHHKKEMDFIQLNQENLSVAEYAQRFIELSRYVPEVMANESRNAKKYQWGLRPKIKHKIVVLQLSTY